MVLPVFIKAARQLEFLRGRSSSGPTTDMLADALAIAQHHDAVSGTQRQHVAADYALRLSMGYLQVLFLLGILCVSLGELFFFYLVQLFNNFSMIIIY